MTGPIRTLLFGLQSTANTRPATMRNMKFAVENEPDMRDVFEREMIEVHNGTVEGDEEQAGGPRHTELTVTVPMYFDTIIYWLTAALGLPSSAANSSPDAVVYDHTFKRATAAEPPLSTFEFYDNVRWRQAKDMICSSWRITGTNSRAPRLQLTFMGPTAADISEPSVPSAVSAYQPANWSQFIGDIGGVASNIMAFTIDGNNNRNPRYVGNTTATVSRYTRGLQAAALDATHDYLAYASSIKEAYDAGNDIANWHAIYTAANYNIGTTPLHPRITITMPKVLLGTMELPTENAEKSQHYTARAGYDSGIASRMSIVVRNLITGVTPD